MEKYKIKLKPITYSLIDSIVSNVNDHSWGSFLILEYANKIRIKQTRTMVKTCSHSLKGCSKGLEGPIILYLIATAFLMNKICSLHNSVLEHCYLLHPRCCSLLLLIFIIIFFFINSIIFIVFTLVTYQYIYIYSHPGHHHLFVRNLWQTENRFWVECVEVMTDIMEIWWGVIFQRERYRCKKKRPEDEIEFLGFELIGLRRG